MLMKAVFQASTGFVQVLPNATATPGGYTSIGTFEHDSNTDKLGTPLSENHVIYHHVRDLLYKVGVQDMQSVRIIIPVAVTGLSILPATAELKVGQKLQLKAYPQPDNATNRKVTYVSGTPARATVVALTGEVTGVAPGAVTITATTEDGAKTDTCVITVVA